MVENKSGSARRASSGAPLLGLTLLLIGCGGGGGSARPDDGPLRAGAQPAPLAAAAPAASFETTEYLANYGLDQIRAAAAYARGATGKGVVVAVVDGGIDPPSPEFSSNLSSASFDVVTDRPIDDPVGEHGSAVSSIVAAAKNDFNTHGVAYEATLRAVRADDVGSLGGVFSDVNVAKAIDYAIDHSASVVNLSMAGEVDVPAIRQALQRAARTGAIVVAARGNIGSPRNTIPADYADDVGIAGHMVAVTAVDAGNNLTQLPCGSVSSACMAAPGENIRVATGGSDFGFFTGTSFAAPHVSGAAALLLQLFPQLSAADVVDILLNSATDLGAAGVDAEFGHGLLNLERAVGPAGALRLPVADAAAEAPLLSASSLRLGRAFGDASHVGAMLNDAVAIDDYKRAYPVALGNAVASTPSEPEGRHLGYAPRIDSTETAIGSRLRARFSVTSRDDTRHLAEAEQRPREKVSAAFEWTPSGHDSVRLSHRASAAQVSQPRHDPAVSLGAETLFNPQSTLLGAGDGVSFRHRSALGPTIAVSLFDAQDDDEDIAGGGALAEVALEQSFAAGPTFRLATAWMREDGQFLGGEGRGAFAIGDYTTSRFYSASSSLPLTPDVTLLANYTHARSAIDNTAGSLLSDWSTVLADAFGFGVSANHVLDDGDRFALMVGQPLRVRHADADLAVATGTDAAGTLQFESNRVSLAPSGRELMLEATYARPLSPHAELSAWVVVQNDAGHNATAGTSAAGAVRLDVRF